MARLTSEAMALMQARSACHRKSSRAPLGGMAGPPAALQHFLWLRGDFEEGDSFVVAAWDAGAARRSCSRIAGTLHAAHEATRTLVGAPATSLSFSWLDAGGGEATAVFARRGGSVLVCVFDGPATSPDVTTAADELVCGAAAAVGDAVAMDAVIPPTLTAPQLEALASYLSGAAGGRAPG